MNRKSKQRSRITATLGLLVLLLGACAPPSAPASGDTSTLSSRKPAESVYSDASEYAASEDTESLFVSGPDVGSTTTSSKPVKASSAAQSRAHSGASSKSSSSSAVQSSQQSSKSVQSEVTDMVSLFDDPNFENGFNVLGLARNDTNTTTFLEVPGKKRSWNLAQWGSGYSFADPAYTQTKDLGGGIFSFVNKTKVFTINKNTKQMTFTALGSQLYSKPRTSGQEWLHLLIEQQFDRALQPRIRKVSSYETLQINLSVRLTKFENHMGSGYNPNLHAAQFLMYLALANNDRNSPDYNQFIWFGLPIFDNRYNWIDPHSSYDAGTKTLIVAMGSRVLFGTDSQNRLWAAGKPNASPNAPWSSFSLDIIPIVGEALAEAQSKGYLKNTSVNQLVFSSFNLGWEVPGTFDVTMEIKDFSILGKKI